MQPTPCIDPTWPTRLIPVLILCGVAGALCAPAGHADEPYALGFQPMPPEQLALMPAPPFQVPTEMPTSLDWSSQLTVAKNQSNCGGCWSFAAIGLLEAMVVIELGAPTSLDLAEQFPLSCDTEVHPLYLVANDGCCGGYVTVFEFLMANNALTEAQLGFAGDFDGDNLRPGCTSGVPPWETVECPDPIPSGSAYRVDSWALIRNDGIVPTEAQLKAQLQSGPVWLGFYVYDDFYTFWNSASPGDVYTHTTGSLQGGHAVVCIGYDDAKSAWLVRNSWGAATGPEGDGTWWMSYTAGCQFGMDAAYITVAADEMPEAACCFDDGSCIVYSEVECDAEGGFWLEASETCDPNPCAQPSACCLEGDVCEMRLETHCTGAGGTWHEGITCTPNPCTTGESRPTWGGIKNLYRTDPGSDEGSQDEQ